MAKLGIGDIAADFRLKSVRLEKISLEDYKGKNLVLVFGRYFGCPVCQLEFDEVLLNVEVIRKKAELIYFTQSSPESTKEYFRENMPNFAIVSVTKTSGRYKVYDDYGVGKLGIGTLVKILSKSKVAKKAGKVHGAYEGVETQSPADFVIDKDGKIIWANRGLLDVDALLRFLESL